MEKILEVKNLRKEFDGFTLEDINFSMEKGFIMGFIGPNGAGKSTTIKLIMNLMEKDRGKINVFGLDSVKDEIEIKKRVGFVYDQNYFYDELTIDQTKKVLAPFYPDWDDSLYQKYLNIFQLDKTKQIKDLSKGMQMKFSLTMAFSHDPELLIMDEPTSGLDPLIRREVLEILSDIIQDENKGIFFSTHITSDLDKIADFVTLINDGQIIFSRAKDKILDNYGVVKGGKKVLKKPEADLLMGVRENKFGFEALTHDRREARKKLGDKVVIDKPTLEDVMLFHVDKEVI